MVTDGLLPCIRTAGRKLPREISRVRLSPRTTKTFPGDAHNEVDDSDRRRAVLLCERHPGAGRSRLLRPCDPQLLRSCDLRRSCSFVRRSHDLRWLQQRLQQLLQAQVLQDQVPSPEVLQAQVLPSLELLQLGPQLLRAGRPDLRRSGCPDLRCSDVRRSGPLLQLVV